MASQLRFAHPGPVACLRFIVLEKRPPDLWVADETASALLLDAPCSGVEEGDILLLKNGEVLLDDQRLYLHQGHGQLLRDGFLTLHFQEFWVPETLLALSKRLGFPSRARRWALVEKALEQQGLGSLMTMRWYKKEKLDTGLLYMRLSSAELAQELIAMEVLDLGGEKAKVFPITKGKTKQNSKKPMHVTPVPKVEPELSSRREPARPCFLCDGAAGGHQAFQCPFWRQCVTIKGASEENREEIWESLGLERDFPTMPGDSRPFMTIQDLLQEHHGAKMLQEKNVEPQTLNFSETSQLFLARLGSVRLGRGLVNLGHRGLFKLKGAILRVYPFRGDQSVEGAQPAAPAMEQPKASERKRKKVEAVKTTFVAQLLCHSILRDPKGLFCSTVLTYSTKAVLIKAAAQVNSQDQQGRRPLHWCAVAGQLECLKLLIKAGADVSAPDVDGRQPLWWARGPGASAECAEELLQHGAEVDSCDANLHTPLLEALMRSDEAKTSILITHGAEVNHEDQLQQTPLFYVADRGHLPLCQQLLKAKAVPSKAPSGRSPFSIAQARNHQELLPLLQRRGATMAKPQA
eukprot:g7102.t1